MATENFSCVFCPATFLDNTLFWEHMNAGTCGGEPLNTPSPTLLNAPAYLPFDPLQQSTALQQQPTISIETFPQQAQLAAVCQPKPSALVTSTQAQLSPAFQPQITQSFPVEYDFTKKSNNVPSYVSPPPATQLLKSQFSSHVVPLTSPSVIPPLAFNQCRSPLPSQTQRPMMPMKFASKKSLNGSKISLNSQPSKWKCTLCLMSFLDRQSLINHVKSPEHEAKIPVTSPPISVKSPAVVSVQTPNPVQPYLPTRATEPDYSTDTSLVSMPNTNIDELELMIRRICREELALVLRKELRNLLSPVLQDPTVESTPSISRSNSQPSDVTSSSIPSVSMVVNGSGDGQIIVMRGAVMHCLVCDVAMSSQANLEAHLVGKKHKSSINKLTSQ